MSKYTSETHNIVWRGISIEIGYLAYWMKLEGFNPCHIEVRTANQEPLPFTHTGYKSHFTDPANVEEAGGPVAYVLAELEACAKSPAWIRHEKENRQLSLF